VRIEGGTDENNSLRVEMDVIGKCEEYHVAALFDTGFTGSIAVPVSIIARIGANKIAVGSVIVADGSSHLVPVFEGKVRVGLMEYDVPVLVLGNDVLVGMELMSKFKIYAEPSSGIFYLEPEPVISRLMDSLHRIRVD